MSAFRCIVITALLTTLVGCATPYQPTGTAGGYYHRVVAENSYVVGFTGNGFTNRSTARDFALLRAAEIGKQLRYDHMVVLAADDQGRTEDIKFGAPTATTTGTISGSTYSGTTTYNSNEVPVYKPKIEISVLYSEGYPKGRHLQVYRISDVIRELKSRHGLANQSTKTTSSRVDFDTAIRTAVSPHRVEFLHQAGWFPNQHGYEGMIRKNPMPRPGAIVVTPGYVMFLEEIENTSQYSVTKVIPRVEIQETIVAKWGFGRRLVVVSDNEVNSFEVLGARRIMIDGKATTEVGELLSGRTASSEVELDAETSAKLAQLDDLRERGILTDAEFNSEKKKLLAAQ